MVRHRHYLVRVERLVDPNDYHTSVTLVSRFGHIICVHVTEEGEEQRYTMAQFRFWCQARGIVFG